MAKTRKTTAKKTNTKITSQKTRSTRSRSKPEYIVYRGVPDDRREWHVTPYGLVTRKSYQDWWHDRDTSLRDALDKIENPTGLSTGYITPQQKREAWRLARKAIYNKWGPEHLKELYPDGRFDPNVYIASDHVIDAAEDYQAQFAHQNRKRYLTVNRLSGKHPIQRLHAAYKYGISAPRSDKLIIVKNRKTGEFVRMSPQQYNQKINRRK